MEKLKFKCGTQVMFIDSITSRRTYAGLMVGEPSAEDNERYIEMFIGMSEELLNGKPYIIEPRIDTSEGYPKLPEYICSVTLTHFEPAKDPNQDMSYGSIVWFQSTNPVIDGLEIKKLTKELKWADVSTDGGW
ncbi:MAG: hypothetical protein JAY82_14360 [Candidatus Thiodiazotropha taylori]|nr:hypothetical protein [Candidatus Thiodiazotropha taylori]